MSVCDYIFVIDKSGSMSGQRIELAKESLQMFIRSLPEGSKFNIISYNHDYQRFFPESVCQDEQQAFKKAQEEVLKIRAGGDNDVLKVLTDLYKDNVTMNRQIYLLTDGGEPA